MVDKKINVLRVITWLPVGGIERKLAALLPKIDKTKFNVSLCCIRERGELAEELEKSGIPVYVSKMRTRWNPLDLWKLSRLMQKLKIDIVHTHMYRSNTSGGIAAKMAGVPIIIGNTHTMNEWDSKGQIITDRISSQVRNKQICVSERVRKCVIDTIKMDPDKAITLYNGVEIDRFKNAQKPDESYLASLGLGKDDKVVIMAARLVKIKNQSCLLQAAKKALEAVPNAKILLAGEGNMETQLKEEAAQLGIANNVIFLGKRDDMEQLYAISHISVLPSDREGFSNTIIESMASGLPVIASDVGGNAEAIVEGECGHIIKQNDDEALAKHIINLLSNDSLRCEMSEKAAQRAELFSLNNMRLNTEKLYLDLYSKISINKEMPKCKCC